MLPIHAPTSGIIEKIALHKVFCNNSLTIKYENCIFLIPDGKDTSINYKKIENYKHIDINELINRINKFGITGLSGSGYPSNIKIKNGILKKIDILIINAAECEPYITADDKLIQINAKEIIEGCEILNWILKPKKIVIGIEDNKNKAIKEIKKVLSNNIILKIIPTKYPSGNSKILAKIITKKDIPFNKNLLDIGIIVHNISTVYAIKRAIINGEPLISRMVTITGKNLNNACNIWVRIGTPIFHILKNLNILLNNKKMKIGGSMMGINILKESNIPITKTINCILINPYNDLKNKKENPCIRCGFCSEVCPVNLLPQQLYLFSINENHKKSYENYINNCIECGACNYVCPSNIPLVSYFKTEKKKLYLIKCEKEKIKKAKILFKKKQKRLKDDLKSYSNNDIIKNKEIVKNAVERAKKKFFLLK